MQRYGLRFVERTWWWVPAVEATIPSVVSIDPLVHHHSLVKRFYGITKGHAWNRAVAWTRAHGDPR